VQTLTKLMLAEDREAFAARQEITLNTVRTLERLRASAGIRFPGDE
jgi:hypothetical protein